MNPITYPARPLNGGRFGAVHKTTPHLWSPKFNGWRAVVHVPTRTMFNRHGERLTIAKEFAAALNQLGNSSTDWLDCEALERRHNIGRGSLIVLDAIAPNLTAIDRYTLVKKAWPVLTIGNQPADNSVYVCHQQLFTESKLEDRHVLSEWWDLMQIVNLTWDCDFYEGLVAKRADSLYPIQLRSEHATCPFWIKHRWHW